MSLVLILALLTLAFVLVITILHTRGLRTIGFLRDVPLASPPPLPKISVIIAARNEAKNVQQALGSALHLDYEPKEIIVVNDRSTDETGNLLEGLRRIHPELQIVTIDTLPPGWLGKNHGQFTGAKMATGEIFLFTDADVVMDPTALRRSLSYFVSRSLDHLAILPEVDVSSRGLRIIVACFETFFNFFTRIWQVDDPKSGAFVGIGAFNMVRRTVYEQIGTHEAIRLRPDDDMRFGKLIKKKGFRQGFLFGTDMLSVEWYESVGDLINGLMKNSFSAANYHLSLVAIGSLLLFTFLIWPFLGLILTMGWARWCNAISSVLLCFCCADNARRQNLNPFYAAGFPFSMGLMIYIAWKASLRAILRGGIEWRGTFYSLEDLKSNRV